MRLQYPTCVSMFALAFLLTAVAVAEDHKNVSALLPDAHTSTALATATPASLEPQFLGVYAADGYFKSSDQNAKSSTVIDDRASLVRGRSPFVPPFVDLHSSETVIEDLAPPARPKRTMKGKSVLANLRDSIITAVYGREQVLLSPMFVTTDSHQRLIIADPVEPAVHVLDGNRSFRIQGGAAHRLHRPSGIAVDSHDNIYVADEKLGIIIVYNSDGQFIRNLGDFRGESMFQGPTGIAIDRTTDQLYVLDSPLNEIVVLDLSGRAVKRIGGVHRRNTTTKFDSPTAIAVGNDSIAVLDTFNSRIQVLDFSGTLRGTFEVRPVHVPPLATHVGIALDHQGNIYTSHPENSTVRIYRPDGELIGSLRGTALPNTRLTAPTGLWVDASGQIFVADSSHATVQVFQVSGTNPGAQPSAALNTKQ
jgi:DNA-binding beta-propeller fold protein YncE